MSGWCEKLQDGRERWHLADGRIMTTAASSVVAMDEAVRKLRAALARLAKA